MKPDRNFLLTICFGIISGLLAARIIKQHTQKSRPKISALRIWRANLAKRVGPARAQQLVDQISERYSLLLKQKPLPDNPILRQHLTQNILPGLSLYQVLLHEHAGQQQSALKEVDQLFRAWVLDQYKLLLMPMKILPTPFCVFKFAFGERMKAFPKAGWNYIPIENDTDRIAFNITQCFYQDILQTYAAPELTASFCKTDEVMAELFPPGIRLQRPHTLGNGDDLCDFRYCDLRNKIHLEP
jgi:hypothetical protein